MNSGGNHGVVEAIAYRPADGDSMRVLDSCQIEAGRGLTLESRPAGKREVTLLSAEQWAATCRQLGAELPWTFRRANFLIRGVDLAAAIGKTLFIGAVRVQVHGETRPCGLMDKQHDGLRTALVPEVRGGVHGEVLAGGAVRVGDRVSLEPAGSP